MAGNSFGKQFRITTWGESHGHSMGVVIDGCPAGLAISLQKIQKELDRRRTGQSNVSSQRKEPDRAAIRSGVFEGVATGAPIHIVIENQDTDSGAYENIKDVYRPGHADYTYTVKYGVRDHKGGGRASARETACRVAAGAVARMFLDGFGIDVFAHTIEIADVRAEGFDRKVIETNDVRCGDPAAAERMKGAILRARKDGDSVGGVAEIVATGVPAGLGEPVYDRFDATLAHALMSINAVKGVEIGAGFGAARLRGSENNDQMRAGDNGPVFLSNNSGGIDGGITNGNTIIARIAVKPTPSIHKQQNSVDKAGDNTVVRVEGRHDPCILPRAVPVAEAMTLITIADQLLLNRATRL